MPTGKGNPLMKSGGKRTGKKNTGNPLMKGSVRISKSNQGKSGNPLRSSGKKNSNNSPY